MHERVLQTRKDFHITPDRIERAVSIALEIAEKPTLKPATLSGLNGSSNAFEVPMLTGSWEQATVGLIDPHDGKRRPITFDHEIVEGRDDVVLATSSTSWCKCAFDCFVWKYGHRLKGQTPPSIYSEDSILTRTGTTSHRLVPPRGYRW